MKKAKFSIILGSSALIATVALMVFNLALYADYDFPLLIEYMVAIAYVLMLVISSAAIAYGVNLVIENKALAKEAQDALKRIDRTIDGCNLIDKINEANQIHETQSLIIKRLEAMPMPKAKFQNMTKVVYQNEIVHIVRNRDWTLRYCIETKRGLVRVYEDELTSLEDYAKKR